VTRDQVETSRDVNKIERGRKYLLDINEDEDVAKVDAVEVDAC